VADPRPDTDEKDEPGGSPSHGQDNLIRKPLSPGDNADAATPVPGAYEAGEDEQERGKAVKPGN
jgi:hypothetical protein